MRRLDRATHSLRGREAGPRVPRYGARTSELRCEASWAALTQRAQVVHRLIERGRVKATEQDDLVSTPKVQGLTYCS